MFYLIPPAGTPITPSQLFQIAGFGKNNKSGDFQAEIKSFTGAKYCYMINSGRSALLIGLSALNQLDNGGRNEVIIPAYTCFSVASAVARAGLKIRLIDIEPETLDYNYNRLQEADFSSVLAIIGCNLLGIPSDWDKLRSIALKYNLYLIDDAAQAMGSIRGGTPAGMSGDLGFYSLGRGKNMTTYSGGILITNNDYLASCIEKSLVNLTGRGSTSELGFMLKIGLYSIFLRPRLYWFPAMIPFLGLGETIYDENFIAGLLSRLQNSMGTVLIHDLAKFNEVRRSNAYRVINSIKELNQLIISGLQINNYPTYLRLPVICQSRAVRDKLMIEMRKIGVIASNLYPSTIRQIPGIEGRLASSVDDFPGAQSVVERLLTIPTHAYLRDKDIERIILCLKRVAA
jgi:perosamine synthetase